MTSTKYLLVGGGLASAEAAKQISQRDRGAPLLLVSDEPHLPYNRPPLSKEFLRGQEAREKLFFVQEGFYKESNVDTRLGARAEALDLSARSVTLSNGETVTFEKLLLATGGTPTRLSLPGSDRQGVYYLRTVDDSEAIGREAVAGRRAVLIGAGFIGLEVAGSLAQKGVQVTVVEALSHIWARFADETLASYFQRYCEERGVRFITSEIVVEIKGGQRPSAAVTRSGQELPCDFVCIGVGIRPNVDLAQKAGLEVSNGVHVNERMQTSHPDVYAAGDVANFPDPVFGKRRRVEHWGHAEYGGQIAGRNMAGDNARYDLLTYVWSDIFDLHLEFAGDEAEHDQTLLRGRFEDGSFTVLFLQRGVLRAYFAVNTDAREFPAYQRLIRRKKDLSDLTEKLRDRSVNVRTLL